MSKTYNHTRSDETSNECRRRESLRNSKMWARLALDSLNVGDQMAAHRRIDLARRYFDTYAALTPEVQTFKMENN